MASMCSFGEAQGSLDCPLRNKKTSLDAFACYEDHEPLDEKRIPLPSSLLCNVSFRGPSIPLVSGNLGNNECVFMTIRQKKSTASVSRCRRW